MRGLRVGTAVLLGLVALTAARADEPTSPWRDAKVVEARFAEACDAVEKATGGKFAARPSVRIVEMPEEAARHLDLLARSKEVAGKPSAESIVLRAGVGDRFTRYWAERHDIWVFPDAVDRLAAALPEPALLQEDVMRVALVHAACHAMDYPRYGWKEPKGASVVSEDRLAFDAVVEGHAELVAEEVAKSWGLEAAHVLLARATVALPPISDEGVGRRARMLLDELDFGRLCGPRFLRAVVAARGPAGLEAVLRSPPQDTRPVEHPHVWLYPGATEGAPDLGVLLAGLAYLVGEPGWKVTEQRMRRPLLEYEMAGLAAGMVAPGFDEIDDARMLAGSLPGEEARLIVIALLFRGEERAQAFVDSRRQFLRSEAVPSPNAGVALNSLRFTDGAGPGGAVAGFTIDRAGSGHGFSKRYLGETALLGRVALAVVGTDVPGLSREALDEAIARAAAWAEDPLRAPPPHAPLVVPRTTRVLTVRVLDGEGKPVPRAWVSFRPSGPSGASHRRRGGLLMAEGGRAVFPLAMGAGTVDVWGAVDSDGMGLPLGPVCGVAVASDAELLDVPLPPGKTLEGRLVTEDGRPVPGIPVCASREHSLEGGIAHSDATGHFTIVNLGEGEYEISLLETGDFAPPADVLARPGAQDLRIVLRLLSPEPITLTIVDERDRPLSSAVVRVRGSAPRIYEPLLSDAQGRVRLPRLDPRQPCALEVRGPGPPSDATHWTVDAWLPRSETLRLGLPFTAKGVVRDRAGAPARATIWRWTGTSAVWRGRTEDDGRFVLEDLPRGSVLVIAIPLGASSHDLTAAHPWTRVTSADGDLVLTLADLPVKTPK